jgi:hypothetical protein
MSKLTNSFKRSYVLKIKNQDQVHVLHVVVLWVVWLHKLSIHTVR